MSVSESQAEIASLFLYKMNIFPLICSEQSSKIYKCYIFFIFCFTTLAK
mgnify:CR=1 FL=1